MPVPAPSAHRTPHRRSAQPWDQFFGVDFKRIAVAEHARVRGDELAQRFNLSSQSRGREPQRRVRILPGGRGGHYTQLDE